MFYAINNMTWFLCARSTIEKYDIRIIFENREKESIPDSINPIEPIE